MNQWNKFSTRMTTSIGYILCSWSISVMKKACSCLVDGISLLIKLSFTTCRLFDIGSLKVISQGPPINFKLTYLKLWDRILSTVLVLWKFFLLKKEKPCTYVEKVIVSQICFYNIKLEHGSTSMALITLFEIIKYF